MPKVLHLEAEMTTATGTDTRFTEQHHAKGFRPGVIYWTASAITVADLVRAIGTSVRLKPNPAIVRDDAQLATITLTLDSVGVLKYNAPNSVGRVVWLEPGDAPNAYFVPDAVRFTGTVTSLVLGSTDVVESVRPTKVTCFAWLDVPHGKLDGPTTHMWFQRVDEPETRGDVKLIRHRDLPDLLPLL